MDVQAVLQEVFARKELKLPTTEPWLLTVHPPFEEREGPRLRTRSTPVALPGVSAERVSVFPICKSATRLGNFQLGITLGRAQGNDIVIPDASISRLHGYFVWDARKRRWRLFDAESRNGTWLNDVRVPPNLPSSPTEGEPIEDGSWIRVGKVDLLFLMPETVLVHARKANVRNP